MRSRLLFALAAPAAIVSPHAYGEVYLSVEQAQALLFPGATLTPDFRTLTRMEADAIEKDSDVNVRNLDLKVWRASTGGRFIVDEVVGKHEFIPIAVGINADGTFKGVEILEYRESFGGQVR